MLVTPLRVDLFTDALIKMNQVLVSQICNAHEKLPRLNGRHDSACGCHSHHDQDEDGDNPPDFTNRAAVGSILEQPGGRRRTALSVEALQLGVDSLGRALQLRRNFRDSHAGVENVPELLLFREVHGHSRGLGPVTSALPFARQPTKPQALLHDCGPLRRYASIVPQCHSRSVPPPDGARPPHRGGCWAAWAW